MKATRWWAGLLAALMALASCTSADTSYLIENCERADHDERSVARIWDEALLDAIRRDLPAPTVHARNLFHVSAAMWDAWAAYDTGAQGFFVDEKHEAADRQAARETAISYAAYRILLWRYSGASGMQETFDDLVAVMEALCYRIDYVSVEDDTPAALGNRIASVIIDHGSDDGALEEFRYVDSAYAPVNDHLVVADPGASLRDPKRWQPLALEENVAQNGLPVPGKVQRFIGSNWGFVKGFALPVSPEGLPVDPGPPRFLGDPDEFKAQAVEVVRYSSQLDPSHGVSIDIGPGSLGNNPLGTNDGTGYTTNPVSGRPYEPNRVPRGDFARVIAEFWADGPDSETPPGHWNTLANSVSDSPGLSLRVGGQGSSVDRLEWDVKLYFALNGALHDAAVAAWGAKAFYDSARPISMIRYMGGLGQSSQPDGPSYHADGLPLVPGLIEVITKDTTAPGERHEHLVDHVGQIALLAWRGNPEDPSTEVAGVGWVLAEEWLPFQEPTFVTPAFAGYVSGHSTFSRAAAEVMTAMTGSPYFPGGLSQWTVPAGALEVEKGPTQDVILQWASYFDAADQAGLSRLYGGIHIPADDLDGRKIGSHVGSQAVELALRYFAGTVPGH